MKYTLPLFALLMAPVGAFGAIAFCGSMSVGSVGTGSLLCPGITAQQGYAVTQFGINTRMSYQDSSFIQQPGTVQAVLTPQGPSGGLLSPITMNLTTGFFSGVTPILSSTSSLSTAVAGVGAFPVSVNITGTGAFPNTVEVLVQMITVETLIGSSQVNPVLPSSGSDGVWTFTVGQSGQWFDPPLTSAYDYAGLGGTTFTRITLPTGFGSFDVLSGSTSLGSFASGASVDFVLLTGSPLSSFRVAGIQPQVDAASPTAFPLQIFFSSPTGSFTQTADTVPETSTLGLAVLPLALLWWRQRTRQ